MILKREVITREGELELVEVFCPDAIWENEAEFDYLEDAMRGLGYKRCSRCGEWAHLPAGASQCAACEQEDADA